MPKWIDTAEITGCTECGETELIQDTNMNLQDVENLDLKSQKTINERFTMIANILPFIADDKMRRSKITEVSNEYSVSKQTVRHYLCLYLSYGDKAVLAPKPKVVKALSSDEKNMRWALNKFFYTKNKNTLKTAYTFMLKEKYCDASGELNKEYPSFYQFRYFYRKTKKLQTYYISRNGLKSYQRNNRPLLGNGIQSFAPSIGTGMLDATTCDIYLVNEEGSVVGRPILTTCIDAYSGLCYGYSLSWEGGIYSIKKLLLNCITEKRNMCKKLGIQINKEDWNCSSLPAIMVTDMGREYMSYDFEQLTELGIKIINLPPYRPELKGAVEKFFDIIQNLYKPHLIGKGIIEPDFQERGAHDYRKDACLTFKEFEKILVYCIIYYNSNRVIKNFPYTEEMLKDGVKPYSSCIWQWCKRQKTGNLINVSAQQLTLSLLPRTIGKFTRHGLTVGTLHYKNENYTERYLAGDKVVVAYNPDNVSDVWLIENGAYFHFDLIETRFHNKSLSEIESISKQKKSIIDSTTKENIQEQIYLANHIETIANNTIHSRNADISSIRSTRKRERNKSHIDYIREVKLNE